MSLKENNIFEFEDFQINLAERTLWQNGELIPLAPKVIETLCLLVENHGRLMTKDELMQELWTDSFVEERNLTQNIFTLRKVLGEKETGKKFIETLPRRGYRFVAEVRPVEIQEVIQVSHSKQTRITAEGFVSTRELTEAVKEIAKSLVLEKEIEAVSPKQIEAEKPRPFYKTVSFPAILILSFLTLGAAVWSWQNNYFNYKKTNQTKNSNRLLLEFQRLTDRGKAFHPTVSPNKQFVAYTFVDQNKYSIHLMNIATGSKTVVVEPSDNLISRPRFSADGNYLFYPQDTGLGKDKNGYRIPIFGGTPRVITTGVNSDLSISPDGEWMAFIRFKPEINGQQLIICRSADGSDEKVVATRTDNESFMVWDYYPAWSPDGKKVFVGLLAEPTPEKPDARGEGFGLMSVEDGSFERINKPNWNNFIQAEWMPDGSSILFLAREKANEPFQIWQVEYPSGEGWRVTNDSHDYSYLNIAPDGEFILTTQEKTFSNLWLISLLNPNETKQLTFSSELIYGNRGISWTPDGKELVYTLVENNIDSNIWKMNVETLEKRQLTFDENKVNWFPRVTPDGKSVIFTSNREKGMHIWQMNLDGSNLRQITDGAGENWSNITADGKWLIYVSPAITPEAIWKKSLTSHEKPIKLLTGGAGSNSISPDNKHFIVSYKTIGENGKLEYKYGLMPFEPTDAPQDLGFNPEINFNNWKADNSGFYWIDRGVDVNNIWFYSIADKSKKQTTNFNEMKILKSSLSPDGKTLAVSRGATVSNIFKISRFE